MILICLRAFPASAARLTAIYLTAGSASDSPTPALNYTLASITPVVVGGTMLAGGKGGVLGTLLGVYLVSLITTC